MSVPLSSLISDLNEQVSGSATGTLDNSRRTRAFNRVLKQMQSFADWDFTKRTKTFYFIDGVYEYSLENYIGATCQDNDGSTAIPDFKNPYDLRPIDTADKSLDFEESRKVREHIRRNRLNYEYSVQGDNLIIGYPRAVSAEVHNCASLTANGTWTASGDATNLTIDTVTYKTSTGSLNFDVSAGTSLVLTNSTITALNLSTLQNKSHFVMWVYLPTTTDFTSVALRWGSDSSNYWEKTETVPAANQSLVAGWNRFAFRWADATETSSPDASAIDYLRVAITYGSSTTDTDFRIDDIRIGQETEMELEYYSKAMVKDAAGDWQREFNPSSVTQTDVLADDKMEQAVLAGGVYEAFKIIGGVDVRDRDAAMKEYENSRLDLKREVGHTVRRQPKTTNFRRR